MTDYLAADDLRATARYIDQHGHTRKVAQDKDGKVCVLGGISCVVGLDPTMAPYGSSTSTRYERAKMALQAYLNEAGIGWSIPTWSDLKAKDKADVTTTLEKAAAWIEEQP
jgi:hypothetical protein